MDSLEHMATILDYTLNTRRKRHILGGLLLSVSLLFGGMALTVMTIKEDEHE